VFPWAHFRATKAAVKVHTLLDLRGSIPSFIHISDGKLHDVHALDLLMPEPGAIYVMDRGYVDFERWHVLNTNHFALPAVTVCQLDKSRWQVELFFKWIKQHLRIKRFYGTSENAVKTQKML
jgi:IS4 transposase